ncbi:hypothetical protein EMIT0180MI3_20032 [Priestia megaterium]
MPTFNKTLQPICHQGFHHLYHSFFLFDKGKNNWHVYIFFALQTPISLA